MEEQASRQIELIPGHRLCRTGQTWSQTRGNFQENKALIFCDTSLVNQSTFSA